MEPKIGEIEGDLFMTVTYKSNSVGKKPRYQFDTTIDLVWNSLFKCMEDYSIYPEFTINGTIHYHILCRLKDKIKFFKSVLPTLRYKCGFVDVQYIKCYDKVHKYVNKDLESTQKILGLKLPMTRESGYDRYVRSYSKVANKIRTPELDIPNSMDIKQYLEQYKERYGRN